jgi:bifunctional non-homologous end joining protein LigD
VQLLTRTGLDWTGKYPPIADDAARLAVDSAYLDGELWAVRPDGTASFDDLQAASDGRKRATLAYFAFDLLYLDGEDMRKPPLGERRQRLRRLTPPDSSAIRYSDHYAGNGEEFFESACHVNVEGIVSKRLDTPYVSGDRDLWRKTKCYCRAEFIIVGYTDPKGSRPLVGSLLLAYYARDGRLVYAGRGGRGISERELARLLKKMKPLVIDETPLDVMPPDTSRFGQPVNLARGHWVKPELVCEVKFLAWTDDAQMREVIYVALREDKPATDVRRPIPAKAGDIDATRRRPQRAGSGPKDRVPKNNIMRVLRAAVVPTREQLIAYWKRVGTAALTHLTRRPLTLVRHVNGLTFFHKGPLPPIPKPVHHLTIEKREGGEGVRVWVDSVEGLLGLLQMDAVELHPWGATCDDIEHPDFLVFDLDPGSGIEWEFVLDTALGLRDMLQAEGFAPWVKTSGGKGLHVIVPLPDCPWDWDGARVWTKKIAQRFATRDRRYTISSTTGGRNRLFIDYLRNGRGSTAVGAYSPRAWPGFPVSMPVSWAQVEGGIRADAYTLDRLPRHLPRSKRMRNER